MDRIALVGLLFMLWLFLIRESIRLCKLMVSYPWWTHVCWIVPTGLLTVAYGFIFYVEYLRYIDGV